MLILPILAPMASSLTFPSPPAWEGASRLTLPFLPTPPRPPCPWHHPRCPSKGPFLPPALQGPLLDTPFPLISGTTRSCGFSPPFPMPLWPLFMYLFIYVFMIYLLTPLTEKGAEVDLTMIPLSPPCPQHRRPPSPYLPAPPSATCAPLWVRPPHVPAAQPLPGPRPGLHIPVGHSPCLLWQRHERNTGSQVGYLCLPFLHGPSFFSSKTREPLNHPVRRH
uniref:Uncharacterized protein n=1 Tax=Myotis myotis TaxID=51298 RepID=A0A7J7RRZ4_MYOMY|nr:hypothetical protein mMyoMyo1_010220 [Myotis myotis]